MNKTKIIAFGDSVTAGTSAKLDVFHDCFKYGTTTVNMVRETQTWCSIAARIMSDWIEEDVQVINAGVVGDTSANGLVRLEQAVLAHSPDYVLVMFGAEDALADVGVELFRDNLKKMVEGIMARNARPILMTPTPISEKMTAADVTLDELRPRQERLSQLVQVVRSLAEEKSLPLIDLNRYFLDNRLAYDHLFEGWLPDAVAQSGMGSFVAGELLPMLGVNDFPKPVLCDYRKAYSDADNPEKSHCAFTDLTYFHGEFFLCFRNEYHHGIAEQPGKASEVVLRSRDGITWVKEAVLQVQGRDNRDPKFLQVDNRLMLYGFGVKLPRQLCEPHDTTNTTSVFERLGPGQWSEPVDCRVGVFWRPKKWRGKYVAAAYDNNDPEASVKLVTSPDGLSWETTSVICDAATEANETQLFVEHDTLMAFSRNEGGSREMYISTYVPSENRWETVSSGRILQAPCVFKAGERMMIMGRYCSQSDERFRESFADWIKFCNYVQQPDEEGVQTVADAAGVDPARIEEYHHGLRTGIFVMDGTRPRLVMELLSCGDSSYTGVAQYGDEYVISDYSMHEYYPEIKRPGDWETPCDIYVSRIRFGK